MNRNEIFIQGMVFGWLLMLIAMAAGWYARTFWTWWRDQRRINYESTFDSPPSMPDLRFLAANEKLRRSNEELEDAIHKRVQGGYRPEDGPTSGVRHDTALL